ncbi:MAG: DUF5777 family beta-barrel protein [Acidobacteriota bacterium]
MLAGFIVVAPAPLAAQQPNTPAPAVTPDAGSAPAQADEDDDAVLDPAEPDFVIVNLPTTLRLPVHKGNFRLTHRFAGNLRNGSFGEQASNLFGLDQGAIIGFEYRIGIIRHVQAAAYRSSFDKTVQLYGKYDAVQQHGPVPVSLSALVSIEGTNNFQEKFAPSIAVTISRKIAGRYAAYLVPTWVNNTAASLDAIGHQHGGDQATEDPDHHDHRSTFYVGVGGRIRVSSGTYLVGEISPRISGYAPDEVEYGFGIEERVGAHMFSLTFTNTFGTTAAQVARGGTANSLYLGFNLARKFF